MTAVEPAPRLDPLAPPTGRYVQDGALRILAAGDAGNDRAADPDVVRTAHFDVRIADGTVEVTHRLSSLTIDNDLTGLLADELFGTGLLPAELFEPVFTGIVCTSTDDPMQAWSSFYANTLASIRWCLARSGEGGSTLADMAPVYACALQLTPPGSVLDLGSCFGFFPLLLAERGRTDVVATDIAQGSMRLLSAVAGQRGTPLSTVACDAARLPLPDSAVDTVTALHLIEHLPPACAAAVVSEAVRVAGTRVVLAVPLEDEPDATYGHVQSFDLAALHDVVDASGAPGTVFEQHGGWVVLDVR